MLVVVVSLLFAGIGVCGCGDGEKATRPKEDKTTATKAANEPGEERAHELNPAQQQAVAEIKKLGDGVRVRLDKNGNVVTVGLGNTQITDHDLTHLKELTAIQGLYLSNTKVTNGGLVHVKGLTDLKALGLDGTQIGDAGLAHLSELKNLQRLDLQDTEVSDAGLASLRDLTELRALYLRNSKVTSDGEKMLKQVLPNCAIVRE